MSFLRDFAARFDNSYLAIDLILNCVFDEAERVEVLNLSSDAVLSCAAPSDRDVAIASKAAFFHLAVGRVNVSQDRTQLAQVRAEHILRSGDPARSRFRSTARPSG